MLIKNIVRYLGKSRCVHGSKKKTYISYIFPKIIEMCLFILLEIAKKKIKKIGHLLNCTKFDQISGGATVIGAFLAFI